MTQYSPYETMLYAGNSTFIEELHLRYTKDPQSVDASWREFFAQMGRDTEANPSWGNAPSAVIGQLDPDDIKTASKSAKDGGGKAAAATPAAFDAEAIAAATRDSVRAAQLIHAYRVRGHLAANLDPLKMEEKDAHPELDPAHYGFGSDDLNRPIYLHGSLGLQQATINQILAILRQTYCSTLGVEFMHIQFPEQKQWIQERIEQVRGKPELHPEEKKIILRDLIEVEAFEEFIQLRFPGMKRFSVQGGDAVVPGLLAVLHTASSIGVEEIVIGMPHRGRMNVLTQIMGKPYAELISIFHGNLDFPESVDSSGDVKYHLGASHDRDMPNGKAMHLSLTANPSHLEIVNPVVCGKVRAKLEQRKDDSKSSVMGLLLHGDAAFAGQGSVAETLSLSELRGYRTGGTVHVIVNNQIGFTTAPKYSRFTPYPSDMAKAVQAPIFHVNGDDPEAVIFVCKLATEFRQKFQRDVVVDIICYRKYGHNETDEPMFTQPIMYKKIAARELPAHIYAKRLIGEGVIDQQHVDDTFAKYNEFFANEFELGKEFKPNKANWLEGKWAGFDPKGYNQEPETGVDASLLKQVGNAISKVPTEINVNSKIVRQLQAKQKMIETGQGIDWATGEALAFGTLLSEGYKVRLSGQDCGRGTFSHRHSVLVDQDNETRYEPLNHVAEKQGNYEVIDSSLSELAIMGFEYGYALAEPDSLTLWEGQFGDFANGAQMVIDQFIASGEIKWLRMCGLVLLLPHGYEGMGPEHSSARPERFLQLCGENNMRVLNCTTPANYYHALRRQLAGKVRKPLIIMTPKSLLRHKLCVSLLGDMAKGTRFQCVLPEVDTLVKADKVQRLIFTSGKVYYDLLEARREKAIDDIAIVRVEQYYPFPKQEVQAELAKYKNAEIVWCQEEPENMGAWRFIAPRITDLAEEMGFARPRLQYAGRREAASPAAGYLKIHTREQEQLVAEALTLSVKEAKKRKAS